MSDNIQVTISQDSVKQIIEAKVHAAVVDALTPNAGALVERVIATVLTAKSTDPRYNYARNDNHATVLGHLVTVMIEEEVQRALKDWAEENRALFAKKLRESMRKNQGWTNKLANELLESMMTASDYAFSVKVTPSPRKEDR